MSNATGIHLPSAQEVHTTSGAKFVSRLSNLIWYIDPHHSKFTSRSCHLPKFVDDLPEYKAKSSYNQYYINSHHKKTEIQAQTLQRHVEAMENSLVQPWASDKKWEQFISEVIQLCEVSRKFIEYLDNVNKRMRIIHNSSVPIRNGIDHIKVLDIDKTLTTNENYNEIIKLMHEKEEFEPTCIDDLILPDIIEFSNKTKESQALLKVHELLPKYSTQQIRKNVVNKYSLYTRLSPAILCTLYQDLIGDASNSPNLISQEMQECIRLMYETQDPNIIFDLQKNGGFKGTKFDEFWDEIDYYFNKIIPAVHERRHTTMMFMPVAISIRELHENIIERLQTKHDEETFSKISIPIQSRLLRKSHPDSHYCAALFRYTRLFAIKFRKFACFISADDKHKVPVGEIVETSTGVRNKATLASLGTELTSCDHDFTKLSVTLSISLFCEIPKDISGSFYQEQVFVSYKDSVFQPSSALRHSSKWLKCLHEKYVTLPEMLIIYTDGGADHRTTFGSVQLAMICLFLKGNFDFLAAV
ncbi:hypothetical protein GLOIN_2v1772386 [Rhizophagus irregularis DAOM 181602=DAOM 197198]|uniref:Uncharacterized protein n=1 Tax=Rhizophagus irregularis (strain DAOM 181602 / DAOM 197198 / MUCL 43194) TaxID=747089 RepID=A0A2P4Q791_RHIID|nr:hypothetical protein GLOIN_2v1772386 [Rhizophagus irregularis DAOM 181602=DAOM 197198]POG73513.1 hypothetical protein GLOIN_2v1772386 [Rhizophagus irregularis DAOM 181602=DAOM 197198]|eukprot:XP_025180379.1 hypothetical protein GLOIN_2v1772386 [Rhizophagus irregularis DAOM 181602=DAOM 197198]